MHNCRWEVDQPHRNYLRHRNYLSAVLHHRATRTSVADDQRRPLPRLVRRHRRGRIFGHAPLLYSKIEHYKHRMKPPCYRRQGGGKGESSTKEEVIEIDFESNWHITGVRKTGKKKKWYYIIVLRVHQWFDYFFPSLVKLNRRAWQRANR